MSKRARTSFERATDLFREKRYAEANEAYVSIQSAFNDYWKYWHNRAGVARRIPGGLPDARVCIEKARNLAPSQLEVSILDVAIRAEQGQLIHSDEALFSDIAQHYPRLRQKAGTYDQFGVPTETLIGAVFELSLTLLKQQKFSWGWLFYEWRTLTEPQRPLTRLVNACHSQSSTTLSIIAEQGLGDTLQFTRFVPSFASRYKRCLLFVPQTLLRFCAKRLPSSIELKPVEPTQPPFDTESKRAELKNSLSLIQGTHVTPLMSLPRLLGITEAAQLNPITTAEWALQIKTSSKSVLDIGIAWQGNPAFLNDETRSIPAHEMLNIMNSLGTHRYHLIQPNLRDEDVALLSRGHQIITHQSEIRDFLDTANIMASLDMVITVDTSVAHLSASLGKRTYIIINHPSDWRWGDSGERSYWYSTATLVRSYRQFDWTRLLHEPT